MILSLAEKIYGLFADSYHRKWDKRGGWRAPVPVISVGNITAGGNGKTPFVILLVKLLQENFPELREQNRIAVLSRGYGRKSKHLCVVEPDTSFEQSGDEPLLIKRSCPTSLVISFAKRVQSAQYSVEQFGARLIILDDGFQHRPLARDLDFVLLDAELPLDNGHLLPAGLLRERPEALARASAFVSVGKGKAVGPLATRFSKPQFDVEAIPVSENWPERPSGPAYLLTGIARPERVRSYLEQAGARIVGHRAFRDHHAFTTTDLEQVELSAQQAGAVCILTTAKDSVRIRSWNGRLPILAVPYSLKIFQPENLVRMCSEVVNEARSSRSSIAKSST